MTNTESLIIYNLKAGKQTTSPEFFEQFGVPAVSLCEFLVRGIDLVTPETTQVVVAGGDGTVFGVLRELSKLLPESAAVSVLAYGLGTDNIAATLSGTVAKDDELNTTLHSFLAEKLPTRPLHAFGYTLPDGEKDIAHWSLGAGAIAPTLLRYLEQYRFVKDTNWRKLLATIAFLMYTDETRPIQATVADDEYVHGWDLAYVSQQFPFWPKFLNVARSCGSTLEQPHDYLLRFGKIDQTKAQTYAGLLLDLAAVRLLGHPVTGTLQADLVVEDKITIAAPARVITVDSELVRQNASGLVEITRRPAKKTAQLSLAFQERSAKR